MQTAFSTDHTLTLSPTPCHLAPQCAQRQSGCRSAAGAAWDNGEAQTAANGREQRRSESEGEVCLHEVLPCIAIPLREGEDEVKLDLQWIFNQAYDPYRRGAVDYEGDPESPLDPDDRQWVYQQLREQGLRSQTLGVKSIL
jgi:Protein of unknown function (DUF4058)